VAGRSAEEVEKFVTRPIEIAMNPAEKKTSIRSSSLFGLSVVKVTFDDEVDYTQPACRSITISGMPACLTM